MTAKKPGTTQLIVWDDADRSQVVDLAVQVDLAALQEQFKQQFPGSKIEVSMANGQVVLRYSSGTNPNGSLRNVAGVANEQGNVFGLMPHTEHAVDALTGSTDGLRLFGSLAAHLAAVPA